MVACNWMLKSVFLLVYRYRAFLIVAVVFTTGCASSHYSYTTERAEMDNPLSPTMENQIIVGDPHRVLDAADWYWPGSLLGKLILWNKNIDSHEISDDTLSYLIDYLEKNEMENVQVLVNVYKPGNQIVRLAKNRTMGAGWRYTLGAVSVLQYTILPGRFFGGDNYNPYTNTINLYSNDFAIALHEAGHAKDFANRRRKGLYSALRIVPGFSLYQEAVASNDALSYLRAEGMYKERKHAYRVLHPAYGTYVGGTLFGPFTPLAGAIGAIPGHITGNTAALFVKEEQSEKSEELPPAQDSDVQGSDKQ